MTTKKGDFENLKCDPFLSEFILLDPDCDPDENFLMIVILEILIHLTTSQMMLQIVLKISTIRFQYFT